jgi:hypothetical protein
MDDREGVTTLFFHFPTTNLIGETKR